MSIRLTAFRWVPPFAQGLVRDLRVRWALQEAGIPYEVTLIGPEDQRTETYLAWQPFGQVPAYEEDGLRLFESAAIAWHVAEKSPALLPDDAEGRARAHIWTYTALNTIEPIIQQLVETDIFFAGAAWAVERRPIVMERATKRLADLDRHLAGREFLEDRFTVGDLLMASVLRIPRHCDLVAQFPAVNAFKERCEARPAFARALDEQMRTFARHAPPAKA